MDVALLPFPINPIDPASWPDVCLADVWQPADLARGRPGLTPSYNRRLFAAQDWETIWPKIDRCSPGHYGKRPVAITRYETSGMQLPLVLQAVGLGMALPRLYAFDGVLMPHQLKQKKPCGSLPLLGPTGDWVGRNWAGIRKIWQQQAKNSLRGLGLIKTGVDRIAVQPISYDSAYTGRREWALNAESGLGISALDAFTKAPVLSEAQLTARVIKPFQAHYRLNRGILEKLRLQARKDPLAPKTGIKGQTPDCSRPHYNWLVVLQPKL